VETVDELLERRPGRLVVSPGPCTPAEAGVSVEAMRRFPEAGVPTLGVCLGHQALAEAFGGTVIRHRPVHGKPAWIEHDGKAIYDGVPSPLEVGRYHSLIVREDDLPDVFTVSARGRDEPEVIMGIRHRELPVEGVQLHPESVLTPQGKSLLANFLEGE
jgi:anthranilate synthase/aminodeoxychorismate synthase-like glutamine amidotransferase